MGFSAWIIVELLANQSFLISICISLKHERAFSNVACAPISELKEM